MVVGLPTGAIADDELKILGGWIESFLKGFHRFARFVRDFLDGDDIEALDNRDDLAEDSGVVDFGFSEVLDVESGDADLLGRSEAWVSQRFKMFNAAVWSGTTGEEGHEQDESAQPVFRIHKQPELKDAWREL